MWFIVFLRMCVPLVLKVIVFLKHRIVATKLVSWQCQHPWKFILHQAHNWRLVKIKIWRNTSKYIWNTTIISICWSITMLTSMSYDIIAHYFWRKMATNMNSHNLWSNTNTKDVLLVFCGLIVWRMTSGFIGVKLINIRTTTTNNTTKYYYYY